MSIWRVSNWYYNTKKASATRKAVRHVLMAGNIVAL